MQIYKNIQVIDTAFGGYGVTKIDNGFTVFVPFTVEGDVVDFEIIEKKKSYAFGKLIKIKEKSPIRGSINCPYINKCGGCNFGHIKYNSQVKIKEKIIKSFFRKFPEFKVNEVITSKNERYRFRATFRLLSNKFGFLEFRSRNFIEIEDCMVCKKSIIEKLKKITQKVNFNLLTQCYIIENNKNEALIKIDYFLNSNNLDIPGLIGIKTKNHQYGKDILKVNYIGGYYYSNFDTFSQSNRYLLNNFTHYATKFIEEKDKVLELYAGTGYFTYRISKKAENVIAIENNKNSVMLIKRLNLKNVVVLKEDIRKIKNYRRFNTINTLFLDPPRSGATKNIIELIKRLKFKKIIYVSCNPSTQARDLNLIKDYYEIQRFYLIDMFPNTHHIESIAILCKK